MKYLLPLMVSFCLFASEVHAMDTAARPCSAWNTARKANLSSVVQREWVYGYLSGLSDAAKANNGVDMYAQLPANESIVEWLNQHCEQQANSTVDAALRELFNRVRAGQ